MSAQNVIGSEEELVALYAQPKPNSLAKETSYLTPEYRQWIELAPFMLSLIHI